VTQPIEHRIRIQLRWSDLDMLGHVSHAVYHQMLEEGRSAFVARVFPGEMRYDAFVLAHASIDYRSEVRRDHGEVEVVVRLVRVGASSLSFEHEIVLPDGTCAASGRSVLVGWDPARRGKRALSDDELAALET
jgi:acyl-CoA thioester hydrolase